MNTTLHLTNKNVGHSINHDSLVDHDDHCQMCDGVFVCNCSVYGTGIGVLGLTVETINMNKTFTNVDYENISAKNTGVCMGLKFN